MRIRQTESIHTQDDNGAPIDGLVLVIDMDDRDVGDCAVSAFYKEREYAVTVILQPQAEAKKLADGYRGGKVPDATAQAYSMCGGKALADVIPATTVARSRVRFP